MTTTPGIKIAGMVVVVFLLGLVSVLGQESEQVGVVRAGQYIAAIQGIFPDGVGEGRSCPVCRICAGMLPDGMGQALAGAALYVVVHLHVLRQWLVLGIILGSNDRSGPSSSVSFT